MKKLLVIMIILLTVGCSNNKETTVETTTSINKITTVEVKKIVDNKEDYKIIDVRREDEYKEGHIKGAENIPVDTIDFLNIDKETKIIVYCRSGVRSNTAAKKLIEKGYKNVYDMGGILDWSYEVVED